MHQAVLLSPCFGCRSPSGILRLQGGPSPFAAFPARRMLGKYQLHEKTRMSVVAAAGCLNLCIGETSISLPLPAEEAQRLSTAISGALQTFAEKQKAERPKRWPSMEFKFKGDPAAQQVEYFEVFCNPNAHATAFDARALITLRTGDGLKLTTEGKLVAVKTAVDECVQKMTASDNGSSST